MTLRFLLIISLLFGNLLQAQMLPDSIFFSDSLNQVLVFHSTGLNRSNPELWITYNLGLNNESDTIAFSRDSAFIVTYNGWKPRSTYRNFSDETGKSVFCIKEVHQKDAFLKSRGFSNEALKTTVLDTLILEVYDKHIENVEGECESAHNVVKGNIVSRVRLHGVDVNLSETGFSYDIDESSDSLNFSNQKILEDIERIERPILFCSENVEFIRSSFYFTSFKGIMSGMDKSGNCYSTTGSVDRRVEIKFARNVQ